MKLTDNILVTLDGSKPAEGILPHVERLARGAQSEQLLLRIADDAALTVVAYPGVALSVDVDETQRAARDYLDTVAESLRAQELRVRCMVARGAPAETILRVAEAEEASLLAMSTHGRTGISRWTMGSVTEKVLRGSKRPMLVVRDTGKGEATRDDDGPLEHILVPIDGSAEALGLVPAVAEIADRHQARVTIAHFVSDYFGREAMAAGEDYLETAAEAFRRRGIDAHLDQRRGDPAASIVDYGVFEADQQRVDLIAMSSHGRSGIERFMLGSVTERVLRHAMCPVLVWRAG